MIIRQATSQDIEQVREIANSPGLRAVGEDRAPSFRWFNRFIEEKEIFFVVEQDKKVIGFILGEKTTSDWMLLWEIGVKENLRSKGIGKKLFLEFEKESKKRKSRGIIAYAHNNPKTLNFFEKNKFNFGETYKEIIKELK